MKSYNLTQGRLLARNSILNLTTGGGILCLKIAFVPIMIKSFGTELYGVLAVTWMVLANFGWLDFGLSRGIARFVSQELANNQKEQAASWVWTAVLTQGFMGIVGATMICFVAPKLVDLVQVHSNNKELIIWTIRLFAFSIPLEFISRSLGGVLEAGQRFEYINGLNLFTTVGTFAVYGVCIMFDYGFTMAIYGLFLLRAVTMGGNWLSAFKVLPNLIRNRALLKNAKEYWKNAEILIRYGFWISVGSVIGPLLIYFDQWVISIIAGISFLPYYTIPFNLLGNLGILPGSLSSTLFPAFSAMAAKGERGRCEDYFLRAHRFLLCTIVPVIFIIFSWSWEILDIWIGNEFANEASSALRILSIGFGISLMAPLSGALLQAIGRPDLLVKLYLWELPFNILSVWFLTSRFGISGAAVSFCLRALVETTLLWILVIYGGNIQVRRFLKEGIYRPCTVSVLFVIAYYIKRFLAEGLMEGMLITLITIIIYCLMIGFMVLDESEKKRLRQALTKGRA